MYKRRLFFVSLMCALISGSITTEAWGDPVTLEFSGYWSYTPTRFIFGNLPLSGGSLSGAVRLPQMNVSGNSTDGWMLTGGTIEISDTTYSTTYVTGNLADGDIVPVDYHANAYTAFQADIVVTAVNNSISSPVLDAIDNCGSLDLSLFLKSSKYPFADILENSYQIKGTDDVVSGSITVIPLPGALALGSIGLLLGSVGTNLAGWLRKRKMP